MRLGFVVYGDVETRTGGFRYDRRLATALRERGHVVEFVELPWRSYPTGLLDGAIGRPLDHVERGLEGPVDALLQDELAHPSLVGCNGRLRNYVDGPLIAVVHHLRSSENRSGPLTRFYRAVERRYLTGIDGAICNSVATERAVRAVASLPCFVAPPAGDRFDPDLDDDYVKRRAPEDPFRLAFVGHVTPRKGVDTLVEAVGTVEACNLTIAGSLTTDRSYAERIRRRSDKLGIADSVTFAGEVSDAELGAILRNSHAVAVPSRHEGYGIAYLEGMSFGLPAIATTAGGASEIITDGKTGFLVEPDDPDAVAEAIRSLTHDRSRLARMGKAARRRFERQPDWSGVATGVEEYLRRLKEAHPTEATVTEGPEYV